MEDKPVLRDMKSRLFTAIFSEREALLNLYNAINQSHYTDPEALEVNTIQGVIFMGMKNDLSFLIDSWLNLYEAQSTWNPNMPLRGLFYFSRLYEGYVAERELDIYSSMQLTLPSPKYVVLYNGLKAEPDRRTLRLSDSFLHKSESEEFALECVATLININYGQNEQLMKDCRKLYEYAFLVAEIRKNLAHGLRLHAAAEAAVEICIQEGILESFLRRHRAEVKQMILEEYDAEFHIKCEKKLSFQEGQRLGELEGTARANRLCSLLLKEKRYADLERAVEDSDYQAQLFREYNLH